MSTIAEILTGEVPPWVMRFLKGVGRGIHKQHMISNGEKIAVGVSGGKDSLALAFALSVRKRWVPITYEITAILVNWEEYPIAAGDIDSMMTFFDALNIDFCTVPGRMFRDSQRKNFNCYCCSRKRREILFRTARKLGIRKIALGHHLDDIVETSAMNLFFRGHFETMRPVQVFFNGEMEIIRPLYEVRENLIDRIARELYFPVASHECPRRLTNARVQLKPIIGEIVRLDKKAREHVLSAHELNGDFLIDSSLDLESDSRIQ